MTDLTNALGEIEDALKEFQDMAYEHTHEGNHIQAGQALKLCAAIRESLPIELDDALENTTWQNKMNDIEHLHDKRPVLPSDVWECRTREAAPTLSTICKESK